MRAYLYMLPGILAMVLVARRLPHAVQEVALAVALSGTLASGAVKGLGLREDRSLFRLTVESFFAHLADVLIGLGTLAAMGGVAFALVEPTAALLPGGTGIRWGLLTGLLVVPWLYAFWPIVGLAYARADLGAAVRSWQRFGASWHLARQAGTERWLVLAGWGALLGALAIAATLPAQDGMRRLLIQAVYLLFLPVPILLSIVAGCRPGPSTMDVGELASTPAGTDAAEGLAEHEPPPVQEKPPEAAPPEGTPPLLAEVRAAEAVEDGSGVAAMDGVESSPAPEAVPDGESSSAASETADDEADAASVQPALAPYRCVAFSARAGAEPWHPFEPGGAGDYFVYLEHRNVCTYLFPPRPVDRVMLRDLYARFERGAGTLYIVEKGVSLQPGQEAPELDALALPSRVRQASTGRFGVWRDPAAVGPGESALVTSYRSLRTAVEQAAAYGSKYQTATLAGRIVQAFTWG